MARSNVANASRHGRSSSDDDDRHGSHPRRDDCDSHYRHDHRDSHHRRDDHGSHHRGDDRDSHEKHGSSRKHESRDHRNDDRCEFDIDLDKRGDGIDFELDMERDGRWLDVEIEIGSLDFDLKLDARQLQPDTSPVVSLLGGDGAAVGEDTLVDADIFSRLIDLGAVTIAFGTAEFTSVAVSDQDPAFAAATTFADVSGADFVFVFNKTISVSSDCESSYWMESSITSYIAIDFEDFDFKEGQIAFNFYDASTYLDGCGKCGGSRMPNIDGNVSTLGCRCGGVGREHAC